ncbi:PAS domain-containing sensor histidine kinase [Pollutibacter soli]|uniref:PAS domain-containing sensor histidine kinase n=1 Tax=Pollutibacter soli TaxID=3034157 RepID=UPI003013C28A
MTFFDKSSKEYKDPGFENAYKFFNQAPVIIGFVRGENYVVEFANEELLKIWKVDNSIYGKSIFAVFPELEAQGFRQLLDNVCATGNPFTAYELPIVFDRGEIKDTYYFDFIYQPFYEGDKITGVIAVGHEVTEKVNAKKTVERGDRKWKQLADSLPVFVWTADEKGSIDFLNARWYEITGLTPEQSLGYGWASAMHPDDLKRCLEEWSYALANRSLVEIEVRYRQKDGTYLWVLARGIPVIENDVLISWHGTGTDISGQKNIERKLEENIQGRTKEILEKTNLLDSILQNSTNGISVSELIFDDAGHVIDARTILANDAAVQFIGLPKEDYLTKPATYFDPGIISSPYGQACIKTLQTGEPFIMRYFLDFSNRWLELTVSRMDEKHLIHNFTDVTTIREAEIKLERTLDELRYSNANLEEFAYAASHDLKEPIRKSLFFANKLKEDLKGKLTVEQDFLFNRLESSQSRMQKLIEDLLEYSQAAKGSADKNEIDLNEALTSVLEDLELEIQKRAATITIDKLPKISGNKRQIHQLFQNLIGNALKYSNQNQAIEIKVSSVMLKGVDAGNHLPQDKQENLFHLIKVSDNGIGFEQKYADKIFKVFTRLHSDEQYRGSGIGLSIVKKVVESHNGFVWAESEEGKGAVFSILLPEHSADSASKNG